MKKYKIFAIMLVATMCLGSASIPNAFSQVVNTNVKVLSYSWYVNPSGDFIVVGEVQNTSNQTLQSVPLNATAYDSSGDEIAGASTPGVYVSYFLPQQKAPFYLDFGPSNIAGTDWTTNFSYVEFTVFNTYSTSDQEYESLVLTTGFKGVVAGAYIVMGFVNNLGNQTAKGIRVVATYYNSSGNVVGVGFDILNGSLSSYNATAFTVSEFDATSSLTAEISNYSLLVQTSTLQGNSQSSASPTEPGTGGSLPTAYFYAIAVGTVAAVILIVVALLMSRKRKASWKAMEEEYEASESST
jgi:hypothetical protein